MTQTRDATATPDRRPPEQRPGPLARLALYLRQVIAEIRKVIWPTRKQLITYTIVVVVFVLIMIGYVSALDYGIGRAVGFVFGD